MMNVLVALLPGSHSGPLCTLPGGQRLSQYAGVSPVLPHACPALALARRPRILPLVALFACSPVVMENATYTWTKSLSAFFVVLAFWFYLAALRKNDRVRIVAAFLALSAGLLVHYSAGPYCLLLGVALSAAGILETAALSGGNWPPLLSPCGLLLATWFAWSLAVFGPTVTTQSNTSVDLRAGVSRQ